MLIDMVHTLINATASLPYINAAQAADSTSGGWISAFTDWVVQIMDTLGLAAVFFLTTLENIFPFIPSELILPVAGFTASRGEGFGIVSAIVISTLGAICGSLVLYALARKFGEERTRYWMGKIPFFNVSDIDKTEAFFNKHDRSTVFVGRMLPVFRCLISLPAGVIKMPIGLFVLYTGAGSLIWNVILVTAGYLLGENWHIVEEYSSIFSKVFIALVLIVCVFWIARRMYKKKHDQA